MGYGPDGQYDPGGDLDQDNSDWGESIANGKWDEDEDQTPAPAAAPQSPQQAPASQPQWSGPTFFLGGQGAAAAGPQWAGPTFFLSQPKADTGKKDSLPVAVEKGAARAGGELFAGINEAANYVTTKLGEKIYKDTGDFGPLANALTDKTQIAIDRQKMEDSLGPGPSVTDIRSGGDAMRYAANEIGASVPTLAQFFTGGVAQMMIQGSLQGAVDAANKYNGDPRAVATGATIQAIANGVPAKFLQGAEGRSLISSVTRSALGMAGFNVATTAAEPLAGVAAGQGYTPQSASQFANAVAGGIIQGGVFGGVGHRGGKVPEAQTEQAPADTTTTVVPEDHQAAVLALPPQDRTRGEGFTTQPGQEQPFPPDAVSPEARPSDGVSRAEMVVQLSQQPGVDKQGIYALRRMKTPDLATAYDKAFPDKTAETTQIVEPTQAALPPPAIARPYEGHEPNSIPEVVEPTANGEPVENPPETSGFEAPAVHPVEEAANAAEPPTPAQAEAGNYAKGHVKIQGLDISIETPEGGVRKGPIDETTGEPAWQAEAPNHYGYIKGTVGADGDQLDVTLGPRIQQIHDMTPEQADGEPVFVIDQIDPATGKFDELKPFVGFHTEMEATRSYDQSFSDGSGPSRRGAVNEMTFDEFKQLVEAGNTKQAISYKPEPPPKPQNTGERLRAQRKEQLAALMTKEQRPTVALVKRALAKPRQPDVKIEPEEPEQHEAAAEVENQPQVFEPPEGSPITVVEEAPAEKQRPGTNKDRQLRDLEQQVVNKILTPTEADRRYGRKEPGSGGRARKFEDFASWLRRRIVEARDPDRQQAILDRARALQEDRTISADKRAAQVREINRELNETGEEYAGKLQEALDELEDPVGAANRRQATQASALSKLRALTPKRNAPAVPSVDHAAGRDLVSVTQGGLRARELVGAIAAHPTIAARMPQYRALAQRIAQLLPHELMVYPQSEAAERFRDPSLVNDEIAGTFHNASPGRPEFITLGQRPEFYDQMVPTILHEAIHAITEHHLNTLTDSMPEAKALTAIHGEFTRMLAEGEFGGLSGDEKYLLDYTTSDAHEMVAMMLTEPTVQRLAAERQVSPEFMEEMRQAGFNVPAKPTLWNAFTSWVRRIMGLPQAPTDTLLDHVIRVGSQTVENGAAFNRQRDTFRTMIDPPAAVESVARNLPRFTKDNVLEKLDPKGLGDKARKALLGWVNVDAIEKFNRDLFEPRAPGEQNYLTRFRDENERITSASTATRLAYADSVKDMLGRITGSKERDKIATLMVDATLADAQLGPKADNSHLTKRDQQAELAKLQQRYNALTPDGQKIYNDFRDYYRKTYAQERVAQLKAMVQSALPDITDAQLKPLLKQLQTKTGIDALVKDPDATPVATAFAERWNNNRALVKQLAKVRQMGFVQGDYFPLRRYGDYVIHYGNKGDSDYGVEMFERRSQAEARRDELVKAGAEPSQVMERNQSDLKSQLPSTVGAELDNALRDRKDFTSEQQRAVGEMFASIMLQHATRSEVARMRLRRQGIKGASTEVEKTLARDFLGFTSRMGYLQHGYARSEALAAMRNHARWLGDNGGQGEQIRAQAVIRELEQHAGDDTSHTLVGAATRHMTNMGFVYSVLRPVVALVHTLDAHSNSMSILGADHGYGRAGLALSKALIDAAPSTIGRTGVNMANAVRNELKAVDWHMANLVRDRLIAKGADKAAMTQLFNRLTEAGLIDHTQTREIQRMAHPLVDLSKGWMTRAMNLTQVGLHGVDVLNKAAIAKAAYDMQFAKTKSMSRAVDYAVQAARDSMPNYNLHNKPRQATNKGILGPLAGPVMQLKLYGLHEYALMANMLKQSMHGATSQERRAGAKAFAGIIATRMMLSGVVSTLMLDPIKWALGIYDWATGSTKPHNYENDVRGWIADAFGKDAGQVISRGLPNLLGVDMHNTFKLSNMLEIPELNSFDSKGLMTLVGTAMTGVAGQDATQIGTSIQKLLQGDMSGLQALMPRIGRDVAGAYGMATEGVKDTRGKTELPASKIGPVSVAAKALGFQPTPVAQMREERNAVIEAREERAAAKTKAIQGFIQSGAAGMPAVRAYNLRHPQDPIEYGQLLQAAQRARSGTTPGANGLTLPKRGTQELERAGRF